MSTEITLKKSTSLIAPENFEHYFRIANMMSKSDMVPKAYKEKPQDVLIAMEMGVSLGLGPLQAVQNIAVINGKPCLYGDGILSVCSGRPDFEDILEEPLKNQAGKVVGYRCTVKRRDRHPVTQIFTEDDAKKANLLGKQGPWTNYPTRMLQMRARAFALRDSFADALGGVRIAEEVQDYEEKDITPRNKVDISDIISNKQKPNVELLSVNKETGEILNTELTEQEQADILAKELARE
jgi:hypothetical protein